MSSQMKIKAIVINYGIPLSNSATLNSILQSNLQNITLELIIWNNGPSLLNEEDINLYLEKNKKNDINIKIFQDIRNISLSMIYNYFCNGSDYQFVSILDQDSVLNIDFFQNILNNKDNDLILPIILTDNVKKIKRYPHIIGKGKKSIVIDEGIVNDKITSITSGISISHSLVNKITRYRGYLFEENLGFYGIDVDFFVIVNKLIESGETIKTYCSGSILHSLSSDDDNEFNSPFRNVEMFYFTIYNREKNRNKSNISNYWLFIREVLRGKITLKYIVPSFLFMLDRKHPRSKPTLLNPIEPTHCHPVIKKQ